MVANSEMEMTIFEKFPKFETLCRVLTEKQLVKSKSDFDKFRTSSPKNVTWTYKKPDQI